MLKILPALPKKLFSSRVCKYAVHHRFFMSDSFALEDVWKKRLNSPILSKIKVDDMYYELDNQFNHFASASALDIDLFSNAVMSENNIEEIEDIVYKLRLTPEAVNILPSTHHAFIRHLLQFGDSEDLLRILNDRLNYGIFPDDYCTILMMDNFLKANNYKNGSKVAILQMLQEDFSNPIIKYMGIYACVKYLENPIPWNTEVEEKPEEDDEEEVKVRVKYLRNPYFDDHFDLVNSDHLLGKTLLMIGNEIPDDVGKTCEVIGSCLYNKWDVAQSLLEGCSKSDKTSLVFKDAIQLVIKHLDKLASEKTDKESNTINAVEKIKNLLSQLDTSGLTSQNSFTETVSDKLKQIIKEREALEIEQQMKNYDEWESLRAKLLQDQINKLNKEKLLAEIKAEKEKIKEKEEELFFFENEQNLDLIIEDKYERPPKKPYLGKKKKPKTTTDDYVPPEIVRRTN